MAQRKYPFYNQHCIDTHGVNRILVHHFYRILSFALYLAMLDHAAPVYYKQQLDCPRCSTSRNLYLSAPALSYLVPNLPMIQRTRHTSVKASTAAAKLPCWYRSRPCCSNTDPSPRGTSPVRRSPTFLPAELRPLDPSSDREPILPILPISGPIGERQRINSVVHPATVLHQRSCAGGGCGRPDNQSVFTFFPFRYAENTSYSTTETTNTLARLCTEY